MAEIFHLENSNFSLHYKKNALWKLQKIVGTGFSDVIIGGLPIQNNTQFRGVAKQSNEVMSNNVMRKRVTGKKIQGVKKKPQKIEKIENKPNLQILLV